MSAEAARPGTVVRPGPAGQVKVPRAAPLFERFAHRATTFTGSTAALVVAMAVVAVWGLTGPLFGFSDTWQLVINTGTTIVTFLMVFLIQRAQNKDSLAIQLKLNEVVAALEGASNRLVNVEDLSEDELRTLHRHYQALARLSKRETDLMRSHSVEEAGGRHQTKMSARAAGRPGGGEGKAGRKKKKER